MREGTNDAEQVRQRHGDGIKHQYQVECHVHGIAKKKRQVEASVGEIESESTNTDRTKALINYHCCVSFSVNVYCYCWLIQWYFFVVVSV